MDMLCESIQKDAEIDKMTEEVKEISKSIETKEKSLLSI